MDDQEKASRAIREFRILAQTEPAEFRKRTIGVWYRALPRWEQEQVMEYILSLIAGTMASQAVYGPKPKENAPKPKPAPM